jgi:propanol-preferring alcohol dehydrogenase
VKACVLRKPAAVDTNPLELTDVAVPEPGPAEVRVRVRACGVCRTDLHVVEGDLPPLRPSVVPGHQVVGTIEALGPDANRFHGGERVGVPWVHSTCGVCDYCREGRENLCDRATFTGYTADGGYAEYVVAPEAFVYPIPERFDDHEAAPLLCAGIIGFRSLKLSGVRQGGRLGLYGFGGAAHIAIQVARHLGIDVLVFTRGEKNRRLALELGASWAGPATETPPALLDGAILFAPAGELVPAALRVMRKGATLSIGGIHMSPIPELDYRLLYHERVIRSVANNTRADGEEFLRIAAEVPVRTHVDVFPLSEANRALRALKEGGVRGAAVLQVAVA